MSKKQNVIFVCTGNSCRSQMAEGWARHLRADSMEPFSAGLSPRGVDPLAVQVMREAGVDISKQESHAVQDFLTQDIDFAITLCSDSAERCPAFPRQVTMQHHPFDDPPRMCTPGMTMEEKLAIYRRVRDEIRDFVQRLPETNAASARA
jgi:arsenate reductase